MLYTHTVRGMTTTQYDNLYKIKLMSLQEDDKMHGCVLVSWDCLFVVVVFTWMMANTGCSAGSFLCNAAATPWCSPPPHYHTGTIQ